MMVQHYGSASWFSIMVQHHHGSASWSMINGSSWFMV
jgi:hypothetical protein